MTMGGNKEHYKSRIRRLEHEPLGRCLAGLHIYRWFEGKGAVLVGRP